jgi:hypothetical protein
MMNIKVYVDDEFNGVCPLCDNTSPGSVWTGDFTSQPLFMCDECGFKCVLDTSDDECEEGKSYDAMIIRRAVVRDSRNPDIPLLDDVDMLNNVEQCVNLCNTLSMDVNSIRLDSIGVDFHDGYADYIVLLEVNKDDGVKYVLIWSELDEFSFRELPDEEDWV